MFEFAELDTDRQFIADVTDGSMFRAQEFTGDGHHKRRGEVGDWQNHFDAADIELFQELAGDVFAEAGYRW
jgi:hypothetical protein